MVEFIEAMLFVLIIAIILPWILPLFIPFLNLFEKYCNWVGDILGVRF